MRYFLRRQIKQANIRKEFWRDVREALRAKFRAPPERGESPPVETSASESAPAPSGGPVPPTDPKTKQ